MARTRCQTTWLTERENVEISTFFMLAPAQTQLPDSDISRLTTDLQRYQRRPVAPNLNVQTPARGRLWMNWIAVTGNWIRFSSDLCYCKSGRLWRPCVLYLFDPIRDYDDWLLFLAARFLPSWRRLRLLPWSMACYAQTIIWQNEWALESKSSSPDSFR